MIIPAFYSGEVKKIDVESISIDIKFTEAGVYLVTPVWSVSTAGTASLYMRGNDFRYRDNIYTEANMATLGHSVCIYGSAENTITISMEQATARIEFIIVKKVGDRF